MLCSAWSAAPPAAASAQADDGHEDRRASLDRLSQTTVMDQHRTGITVDRGRLTFMESTWPERVRFKVDDFLSSSTYPRLSILGTSTGVLLAMATLSFWRLSGVQMEPREAAWRAWTTIADPGTHTLTPSGQGRMRSVGVIFTLGGLFFFALLIGLVNDGITTCASCYSPNTEGFCLCLRLDARTVFECICAISADLDDLQAGRTKAVVSNHVVVAGFSHKLKTVLAEFGKADRDGRSVSCTCCWPTCCRTSCCARPLGSPVS